MTGLKFELDIDAEIEKLGLPSAKPANSANQGEGVSNFSKISNPLLLLDVFNPETKKTPRLNLLTEIERQAFDGWFMTAKKTKFGLNEEEAKQVAWKLLIESVESMGRRGAGRYATKK